MLSLVASCIIAITSQAMTWPLWALEAHERGHCACPHWIHPETATLSSELLPPKECQFKGEMHIIRFPADRIRNICKGAEACMVNPNLTVAEFTAWAFFQ